MNMLGDTVSLNFNVVKIGEYNNIIFESLDYLDVYKRQSMD